MKNKQCRVEFNHFQQNMKLLMQMYKEFLEKTLQMIQINNKLQQFIYNIYKNLFISSYKVMCKILFSNIIEENFLKRGLFQLIEQQGFHLDSVQKIRTETSTENSQQSEQQVRQRKNMEIQNEIFNWFQGKNVVLGNPEDLVYQRVQQKKAIIIPKKVEINGVSANKIKLSSLLSRRSAKLVDLNVSG